MDNKEVRYITFGLILGLGLLSTVSFNLPQQLGSCLTQAAKMYSEYFVCKIYGSCFLFVICFLISECCSETKLCWYFIMFFVSMFAVPDFCFTYQLLYGCTQKPKDHTQMVMASWVSVGIGVVVWITLIYIFFNEYKLSIWKYISKKCWQLQDNNSTIPNENPARDTAIEQTAILIPNNDSEGLK